MWRHDFAQQPIDGKRAQQTSFPRNKVLHDTAHVAALSAKRQILHQAKHRAIRQHIRKHPKLPATVHNACMAHSVLHRFIKTTKTNFFFFFLYLELHLCQYNFDWFTEKLCTCLQMTDVKKIFTNFVDTSFCFDAISWTSPTKNPCTNLAFRCSFVHNSFAAMVSNQSSMHKCKKKKKVGGWRTNNQDYWDWSATSRANC